MNALTRDEMKAKLAKLRDHQREVDREIARLARMVGASQPKPKIRRRSRYDIPDCGTESGYQRHRYRNEERCDDCKKAHAEYTAKAAAKRRAILARIVDAA